MKFYKKPKVMHTSKTELGHYLKVSPIDSKTIIPVELQSAKQALFIFVGTEWHRVRHGVDCCAGEGMLGSVVLAKYKT